jgi:hypothetical protein
MTESDPKKTGSTPVLDSIETFDSIEAFEEFLTKLLSETTNPMVRQMAEETLAHCADLKKVVHRSKDPRKH